MLQTFPKDFTFAGTKADLEQMIGNAVPVKLAEYVANCVKEYIAASQADSDTTTVLKAPVQLSLVDLLYSA